ncbi:hypothetical protein BAUCODRAFT_32722 [Baudoinia panamericana UAMH 10762]|uniref:Cercosporin MFS transporter CTB4 n=1 Tax=Baudoinia panamericana (strain UAMH 10762) TaxID=717646 RepID=M2NCR7_BAUPA|nr:uncharacterized protein BAUCODRAFT_32722 [Baudoinia panamericana UAMH 10762]EMC96974.1 hypothetical protein BAUCODRAFT_32722 [Baudoinia panamericana UAMH 10762]
MPGIKDLVRDAPFGQLVRYVTGNKVFLYPEEKPDFQCPADYAQPQDLANKKSRHSIASESDLATPDSELEKSGLEPTESSSPSPPAERVEQGTLSAGIDRNILERLDTSSSRFDKDLEKARTNQAQRELSRISTKSALGRVHTQAELQEAWTAASHLTKAPSRPIVPQRTADGVILVDWYTTDDQENPQNWPARIKIFASLSIYLYTLAVYMGSAIYTPSEFGLMKQFGVSQEVASLGLALYVLAYGLGPLFFSPLSEIPSIGRNPPYIITMAIFVILLIPSALVNNFAGLMVLRFLSGFFGSPALATGGASLQDLYSLIKLPYVLCLWALAATCGPALGPIISGFSVTAENWRWSMWELLWLAGPVFLMMFFFLPETSSSNILLRRAQRLRKLTGNNNLKAQSEIDQANMRPRDVAFEALVRPIQLIVMDPAIGFTAFYVGICYGIYYSFFEVFGIVYMGKYGFNIGQMGLAIFGAAIGCWIGAIAYVLWTYYVVEPYIKTHGLGAPERFLLPALVATLLCPTGLFLFAWTGDASVHVHWIVSIIGAFLFITGVFIVMQCIFMYLPMVYPQYAASLFAGNDFARSSIAFAAILFSRPMFTGLGVGPGTSLLGALTAVCVGGIYVLYFFGPQLRARSRFSAK